MVSACKCRYLDELPCQRLTCSYPHTWTYLDFQIQAAGQPLSIAKNQEESCNIPSVSEKLLLLCLPSRMHGPTGCPVPVKVTPLVLAYCFLLLCSNKIEIFQQVTQVVQHDNATWMQPKVQRLPCVAASCPATADFFPKSAPIPSPKYPPPTQPPHPTRPTHPTQPHPGLSHRHIWA